MRRRPSKARSTNRKAAAKAPARAGGRKREASGRKPARAIRIEWGRMSRPRGERLAAPAAGPRIVPLRAVQDALLRPGESGRPYLAEIVAGRLGGSSTVRVELAAERPDQWTFRLVPGDGANGTPALALRVSKAPGPSARLARTEYQQMRALHAMDGSLVPAPLAGGALHVERPRPAVLYAYLTHWPEGFVEVGFDADGAVTLAEGPGGRAARVGDEDAEVVRERVCEVLARCYDPARQTAIWPVEPLQGDFVARREGDGDIAVRLVAPRATDRSVPPARLVALMADPQWKVGLRRITLAPEGPGRFERALTRGFTRRDGDPERGLERARRYLSAYEALVRGSRDRQRWNPPRSSSSTSFR